MNGRMAAAFAVASLFFLAGCAAEPVQQALEDPVPEAHTVVYHIESAMPASATMDGRTTMVMGHGVTEDRPANLTGILAEMVWTNPGERVGRGKMTFSLVDDGQRINETDLPDARGVLVLRAEPSSWKSGLLSVGWWPSDEEEPNVVAGSVVEIYVTLFTGGTPNPQWTAVPES